MLRVSLTLMLVVLAGCPGGGGDLGASCSTGSDCRDTLQCLAQHCVERCQRAPDCGDGYSCDRQGLCHLATGHAGAACTSEVDCEPGLSCQIDGSAVDDNDRLLASCTAQNELGRPNGAVCAADADCRNGTCALGHCMDLCAETRDCSIVDSCAAIPRVEVGGTLFSGCVPSTGKLTWQIKVPGPAAEILLPVPDVAHGAELVMSVDDGNQKVGAAGVVAPSGTRIYTKPCEPPLASGDPPCNETDILDQYFGNPLRHLPDFAQSVLALPATPNQPLETGAYHVQVSSFRSNGTPGSATPHVTAVLKLDTSEVLDLHFYFLDLAEHPCAMATNGATLDADAALKSSFFQDHYLATLRMIIAAGGVSLGRATYENITDHHDLDGLDIADIGSLLPLGNYDTGINVFFVRTLSPVGLQAFGPNPGPAGLANNRQSGVVVALDTLCYRQWEDVARLTAHEIARYMGLYHNVEITTAQHPTWRDPIDDSNDSPTNLMFYSEFGGTELSPGQRQVLGGSPVLR